MDGPEDEKLMVKGAAVVLQGALGPSAAPSDLKCTEEQSGEFAVEDMATLC